MDAAASQTLLQRELTMKITKNQLADLVTEELVRMVENGELDEGFLDRLKARGKSVGTKIGGAARGAVQKGLGGIAGIAGEEEMATKMRGKAAATAEKTAGDARGMQGKSLLKGKIKKIAAASRDLKNDMSKLGIDDQKMKYALEALDQALGYMNDWARQM